MHQIGRIICRGGIAGLFLPFRDCKLDGIYEVREIMGELQIVRMGDPAMPRERFTGLDLGGLYCDRATAGMTAAEYAKVCPT